jgi:hypothetical protein
MSPGKNGFSARSSSTFSSAIERLISRLDIHTMLLEMLLAGSQELDSGELVAVILLVIIPVSRQSVHIPTSLES